MGLGVKKQIAYGVIFVGILAALYMVTDLSERASTPRTPSLSHTDKIFLQGIDEKMTDEQLLNLISSNIRTVVRLEELMGTSVDNPYTKLREQQKIFIRQVELADGILRKRGRARK